VNRFAGSAGSGRASAKAARGKDRLGLLLIACAMAALGAMAAAGFALRPPPIDAATLCRTDQPIGAHTFILVDATDRLEPRHRRKLQAVAAQERARLAPYDRLSIASLRWDRPEEPRLLFSLCLPPDGTQVNPLFANPARAQARWDETIGGALKSALSRAGSRARARASPISAGVRAAAADADFGPEIGARRLVLVSDLMEHAPGRFSLYEARADYPRYRAAGGAPAALDAVAVRVVTLDRPTTNAAQEAARDGFWADFFDDSGAAEISFDAAP